MAQVLLCEVDIFLRRRLWRVLEELRMDVAAEMLYAQLIVSRRRWDWRYD